MTGAVSSHDVELQLGDGGSPEAFTQVCEILNFNGPNQSAPQIDVTSLCSDAREYIPGLKDGGEFSFDLNYVPGDQMQYLLEHALSTRVTNNFRLVINAGSPTTTYTFAAIVTQFGLTGAVDQQIQAAVTLKITGDVTRAG